MRKKVKRVRRLFTLTKTVSASVHHLLKKGGCASVNDIVTGTFYVDINVSLFHLIETCFYGPDFFSYFLLSGVDFD